MGNMQLVLDIIGDGKDHGQDLFDASHKFNTEAMNHGNDSYYQWEVVENPTGEEEGFGYLTDEEAGMINDFCLVNGAAVGDFVLIYHSW